VLVCLSEGVSPSLYRRLDRRLGGIYLEYTPHPPASSSMHNRQSEVGPRGASQGTAVPGARAPVLDRLGLPFGPRAAGWSWSASPWWAWPGCAGWIRLLFVLLDGLVISCEFLCLFGPFLLYFLLYLQNKSVHQNYGNC
jgi:hypothetical protein